MSYEELAAHGQEIKDLAISKTMEIYERAIDSDPDATDADLERLRTMTEENFAGVENVFDDWLDLPDPYILGGGTGNIAAALPYLGAESYITDETGSEWAGGAGTSANIRQIEPTAAFMQGWTSGTSLSYSDFASNFGPVTANLSMTAQVLKGACEAEEALWTEARKAIDDLAHATIDALGSVNDKDPKSVTVALAVVGAVSSIVAIPFTAGASATMTASFTFAAIAGGLSIGGALVPDEETKDSSVSGSTPRAIIESLQEEMGKLNADIKAKEEDIQSALERTADDFAAAYALPSLESPVKMPRPSVADNPSFGGRE